MLTVEDAAQKTGVRIRLTDSFGACRPGESASVCSNTNLLNELDGFSVNPRLMVCFSGPVDGSTLKDGIRIEPTGKGGNIGINQIVFDPASNCAFAKPESLLEQQSQYLLIVRDSVRNSGGAKVERDPRFEACLSAGGGYCGTLAKSLKTHGPLHKIVAASLFNTMSVTPWLDRAHQFVSATQLPIVLPAGIQSVFPVSGLKKMTWVAQDNSGPNGIPQDLPLSSLEGVGKVAFGFFLSPNFLNPLNGTIPTVPTGGGTLGPIALPGLPPTIPSGYLPVSFHVFLPSTPAPRKGYPVVIFGHGLGDSQFGAPTYIASTLAKAGIATLAFEITGHGYGPGSVVALTDQQGHTSTVLTPGRGIPIASPVIGATDGCLAGVPAVAVRDCARQSAVDLFALVRTMERTGGLGFELDPDRISYVGQSLGATYGTMFLATEPNVRAAVLSGAGGSSVDAARLSIPGHLLGRQYLASVGLLDPAAPGYDDSYPLRDAPPLTPAPGATAFQAAFEAADWLAMLGDPLSFGPHLTVPTLFQIGVGDLEIPNPTSSALIRAAGAEKNAWLFRYDVAAPLYPELTTITMPDIAPLPIMPHRILSNPTIADHATERTIAVALQEQARDFVMSDGKSKTDPNDLLPNGFVPKKVKLFEVPKALPETLSYPF